MKPMPTLLDRFRKTDAASGWNDNVVLRDHVVLRVNDRVEPKQFRAWILLEITETYLLDLRATPARPTEGKIEIRYRAVGDRWSCGSFSGSFSERHSKGSITSGMVSSRGGVMLGLSKLSGQRIGTYLMCRVVEFVQQLPNAELNSVHLAEVDASDSNRERRNRFYEQFGLRFEFNGPGRREGNAVPMLCGDLTTDAAKAAWGLNIVEYEGGAGFERLVELYDAEADRAAALARQVSWLKAEMDKRDAHPLRWALKVVLSRWFNRLGPFLFVATLIGLAVWRWRSGM